MNAVVLRRERNTLLWDDIIQQLSAKEQLKLSAAERPMFHDWCPYLAAYQVETCAATEKVFERLNTKDFFASTWPDVPGEVIRNPDKHAGAISLRNFRIYLPVHQSVSVRHLQKLIREIHNKDGFNQLPSLDVESNQTDQASWQSLLNTVAYPVSILQDWQYGNAKHISEGWLLDRRVYSFQGKPVAIAQFLVKRLFGIIKIYLINRGPVFLSDNKKLTEAVISSIAVMGNIKKGQILMASFNLERNHINTALLQRYGFITCEANPYTSSCIDLSASEQTLRSKLAGKWRNMLVYAEKRDIVVTTSFDRGSIEWMCAIHEKNMAEKKFQGIQSSLLKAYTDTVNAGVYKAVLDDQVIGAVCVACHGNTCTYLIGWTNEAGRINKANYLLLWNAILDSKHRGYRFFDSGGIDTFSTEGIANFKLGLNGQLYALIPTGLKF
jgi:hypothetical protein